MIAERLGRSAQPDFSWQRGVDRACGLEFPLNSRWTKFRDSAHVASAVGQAVGLSEWGITRWRRLPMNAVCITRPSAVQPKKYDSKNSRWCNYARHDLMSVNDHIGTGSANRSNDHAQYTSTLRRKNWLMPAIHYGSWRHTTRYGRSLAKLPDSGVPSLKTENAVAHSAVLAVWWSLEGSKLVSQT